MIVVVLFIQVRFRPRYDYLRPLDQPLTPLAGEACRVQEGLRVVPSYHGVAEGLVAKALPPTSRKDGLQGP